MLKKLLLSILIMFSVLTICFKTFSVKSAIASEIEEKIYSIYNENSELISTAQNVCEGDMFISSDNKLYYVYYVDSDLLIAYAGVQTNVKLPSVRKTFKSSILQNENKKIGIYHTHNAESYVIGDGYDSVYGRGGVMDIGVKLKNELEKKNVQVSRSENLHLPHDSMAYSRSSVTAKSLLNANNLDAIFDVHRDGVSRDQYLTKINGIPGSKIRMVVGKANATFQDNLDFALAIKAYADENFPGLIKDIYMASGHYNQALHKRALLFEMGTYLIEKDYVLSSTDKIAECVDKVLYTASVESPSGESSYAEESMGANSTNEEQQTSNDLVISENAKQNSGLGSVGSVILILACLGLSFALIVIFIKKSVKEFK